MLWLKPRFASIKLKTFTGLTIYILSINKQLNNKLKIFFTITEL